jgi:hypothetical protein
MRFAAAAAIVAFFGLQGSAWGQDTPVRKAPVEPPLESVISHFFPGYGPLPLGDLAPEIGALTVSDPVYDTPDRSPTTIHADFDGNGFADYALLIRKTAGPAADEIFVILMARGQGQYSEAMESFFGGIAPEIYLGYLPAGTVLPLSEEDATDGVVLTLENPAVTLNVFGRASDAFYWDEASARFMNVPAQAASPKGLDLRQ